MPLPVIPLVEATTPIAPSYGIPRFPWSEPIAQK